MLAQTYRVPNWVSRQVRNRLFGTHGMVHLLETVLEAASPLRENPEIMFLMVGDGAERNRLMELRNARG